ncbi:A disintegrin and metalloproteinase with thrombospondin motifs 12-like [Colletes gigas]|uniref:A disintegrin and metalloproteinase with thrombospondin motifs 12-like n=1 Tax=Colletes gigas TaxID=935657 RepID=UPI001C9A3C06|nr:A disintegrin and metalloproteinase with thrombospondin motifs 12-like [Colletes gigas]
MSRNMDQKLLGRYTRDSEFAGGYEIVVPRKVRSDGKFVSHQIPHHFKRSFYAARTRTDTIPDDAVHYRLQIDDEEHHLELRPNHRLVAPGAVIEEHTEPKSPTTEYNNDFLDNSKLQRMRDSQCHYQGRVHGQSENSALSTCYGLAGYIRTKRSWYTIEPVAGHDFTKEAEYPHVVYKKRPDESGTNVGILCNVTGSATKTIAKRAFSTQKRHPPNNQDRSYTLELLLVLDKPFLDYHQDFDVENYVLTLLNMAAGLLHDDSLGVLMELSIVRIIRMHVQDDEVSRMELAVNKDADKTLKYFQTWQEIINPGDDSHPNHHDCAVLLAKTNICESTSLCGFTGTSTIDGTCDPRKAAAIVRDVGLQTGYHITHHIGHTLGMSHDIYEENGCHGVIRHGSRYIETTIMYPGSPYVTKRWSKCSRKSLKSYIEEGRGFCLEDEPQDHDFPVIELLPGVMYNGDDQCRLLYHQDARQCDLGIWCYEMKCLMVGERPGAVDGGWGGWSPWSRCSRSCGSGVAFSIRRCNSPSPSNGGTYCYGDRKRHKICASIPCDTDAPSFRDVQCSEFNNWIFPEDGKVHRWTTYNLPESNYRVANDPPASTDSSLMDSIDRKTDLRASENPCSLYCLSETNLVASLRPKVIDGTTCYRGIRDICIGGLCKGIPCDLNMESNAVEDACGVCKGNGTSCKPIQGTITIEAASQPKKIIDVPAGSTNVRIEELEPTRSRIMVRTADRKPLIDGDRLGMFEVAGTKAWLGTIRPNQEALNIPGPVMADLAVLILPKENATVKYSLGLKEKSPRKAEFAWGFVDWEECSANCGPGEQISKPRCLEKLAGLVDDSFCKNVAKPEAKVKPCHRAPCLPRWMIGDWQGCASCVPDCERRRAVKCVRPVGYAEQDVDIIADSYCHGPKPKDRESCGGRRRRDDVLARQGKNKIEQTTENASGKHQRETTKSQDAKENEAIVDKENIGNLTLTIFLERDEENGAINFPKDFEPQPPANSTVFTLVGMDAVRYIEKIQEDRVGSK